MNQKDEKQIIEKVGKKAYNKNLSVEDIIKETIKLCNEAMNERIDKLIEWADSRADIHKESIMIKSVYLAFREKLKSLKGGGDSG
jgi:hypothetical protein